MEIFEVQGEPKGQGRPRVNKFTGAVYKDSKDKDYEEYIAQCYLMQTDGKCYETPLIIGIDAVFIPPKSTPKTKLDKLYGAPRPRKPDIDNIAKSVLDGLNKVAYKDDNQITELICKKYYGKENKLKVIIQEVN